LQNLGYPGSCEDFPQQVCKNIATRSSFGGLGFAVVKKNLLLTQAQCDCSWPLSGLVIYRTICTPFRLVQFYHASPHMSDLPNPTLPPINTAQYTLLYSGVLMLLLWLNHTVRVANPSVPLISPFLNGYMAPPFHLVMPSVWRKMTTHSTRGGISQKQTCSRRDIGRLLTSCMEAGNQRNFAMSSSQIWNYVGMKELINA
jgi:hypothetical protein